MPLLEAMKRVNLGGYFETLVYFWLQKIPEVDLIEHNLQIWEGKRTVGELDLLFQYQGVVFHWELSIKLYANLGDPLKEANWIGPMKKDTLARKFARLFDHQLQLPNSAAGSQALSKLGINTDTTHSYPFVKGCLFHENEVQLKHPSLPKTINPDCLQQTWYDLNNLQLPHGTTHLRPLKKLHWMGKVHPAEWEETSSDFIGPRLESIVTKNDRPILVAFGELDRQNKIIRELARNFIMPEHWRYDPVQV